MKAGCVIVRTRGSRVWLCVAAAALALPCLGCLGDQGGARRWLDPLGLTNKQELSQQPDFRKRVSNDAFPNASQVGLASGKPTSAKQAEPK